MMQHVDALYAYAVVRVKNHHTAQDLVQDCLLAAYERRDRFGGRSSLRTWMIGILKFKVLDYFRRQERTPTARNASPAAGEGIEEEDFFDAHGSWKVDPRYGKEMFHEGADETVKRGEVMDLLRICLEHLPERLRVLFSLREVDGLDVPAAASAVGVTTGSASVLLTRTRKKLRSCLQKEGVER